MSRLLDKVNLIQETRFADYGFFGQLAASMVMRDELNVLEKALNIESHSIGASLQGLNPDRLSESDIFEFAPIALGHYITNRRIDEARKAMYELDILPNLANKTAFLKSKVLVKSNDISRYHLSSSVLIGVNQRYDSKEGTVLSLNLSPLTGGQITIAGNFGKSFSARPLIDRHNDYQIAFGIAHIE